MEPDFSHLVVEFFLDARQNKRKSAEAGRPIFDDVEMVKIRAAGDPKTVFVAPAQDQSSVYDKASGHRLTYAELHPGPYEAFKRGQTFVGSGTRLSVAGFLEPSKVKELEAAHIHTVEQLAELDGANLQRLGMGARDMKEKAQAYLNKAGQSHDIAKLLEQIEDLKAQIGDAGTTKPPTDDAALNPFADWDKDTLKLWMEEQGGKWDARWSVETARERAAEHNASLQAEAA